MSEDITPESGGEVDVRQLARELIAEELDLDDIFEDRAEAPDTQSSRGERAHRAAAAQWARTRSEPRPSTEADKVVVRQASFGPMRLGKPKGDATRAATLPAASAVEPTTISTPSALARRRRRHPLLCMPLLLLAGVVAALVAHHVATRAPYESPIP